MAEEKPEHNKYDNIYEIRKAHNYGTTQVLEILRRIIREPSTIPKDYCPLKPKHAIYYHNSPESFIIGVQDEYRHGGIKIPAWKILCSSCVNPKVGAIYYIIQGNIHIHVFRGTYGYGGTGPHQSAVVETYIEEKLQIPIELRSGDYLLTMLELI